MRLFFLSYPPCVRPSSLDIFNHGLLGRHLQLITQPKEDTRVPLTLSNFHHLLHRSKQYVIASSSYENSSTLSCNTPTLSRHSLVALQGHGLALVQPRCCQQSRDNAARRCFQLNVCVTADATEASENPQHSRNRAHTGESFQKKPM